MNKGIMFLWTIIICAIWGVILFLGFRMQDREYINLTSDIKKASKIYMHDKKISPKISESIIIFIDELINQDYLKENKKIDEYCIESVVYTNELFKDKITINKNCEKNEE